jgi:CRISPR-associated protein Csx17
MPEVILSGCAPAPLADYLKALGILRLVAEQADPAARGWWRDDRFRLDSRLDAEGLAGFFLDAYRPTPIIAPWNGGSGFYPKDNKSGIGALRTSSADRFAAYAEAIRCGDAMVGHLGLKERPKDQAKRDVLRHMRANLPDAAVDWLDAAVLLTQESPKYPPLLGTGGNDGRLDFTNNLMQRLTDLIDPATGRPRPRTAEWLAVSLHGAAAPGRQKAAVGQFAPGAAGGPNAGTGFEGESLVNPWDFVLTLEGALLFAAAASRRLEAGGGAGLSYPFTVRPAAVGSGGTDVTDEEQARAEIWLPLWGEPALYPEIRALMAEGRATLGRRAARDGLDFARSVARLGIARGIGSFQRYGLFMRSGKAFLATPLNRIDVQRNRRADLIDDLDRDRWLSAVRDLARRQEAPARVKGAVRSLEDALFEMTQRAERPGDDRDPAPVQRALVAVGDMLAYLARAPAARRSGDNPRGVPPLRRLSHYWALQADDGSDEFRIAAALAWLGADDTPMRCHLAPLGPGPRTGTDVWIDPAPLAVWGGGDLTDNLVAVLQRRLIAATRQRRDDGAGTDDAERPARDKPLAGRAGADLPAIAALLNGQTDDRRIAALLGGLAWVTPLRFLLRRREAAAPLPAAYAALKAIFAPDAELHRLGVLPDGVDLPVPPQLVGLLAAGRVDEALAAGLARTRASGLPADFEMLAAPGLDGRRLAAALLVPLTPDPKASEQDRRRAPWADPLRHALIRAFPTAFAPNEEMETLP